MTCKHSLIMTAFVVAGAMGLEGFAHPNHPYPTRRPNARFVCTVHYPRGYTLTDYGATLEEARARTLSRCPRRPAYCMSRMDCGPI